VLKFTRVIAAAIIPAAGIVAALAAPAQAATTPSSSIYSATQNACLNLVSTNPANSFLDAYGAACNGSAAQGFTFQALSTGPQDTFHIISQATGQCMIRYRFGIRPDACSLDVGWTFQRVGTTGHHYNIVVPSSVGTTYPQCIQVNPKPRGYPGAVFTKALCTSAASQVLSLTTAPL
jgi:hypothetical protein